jgi:hypothetical protein
MVLLAIFLWLAIRSTRFWPIWVAALLQAEVFIHVGQIVVPAAGWKAYMNALAVWGWVTQIVLIVATWRHRQRLAQHGSDASWKGVQHPASHTAKLIPCPRPFRYRQMRSVLMTVMPNSNDVQAASLWPANSRALVCRAFLRVEKVILESLGPLLSARQYVALLFEVYLAEIEGKTLYQACLSTDEIVSKPHRRSARLAQLGASLASPVSRIIAERISSLHGTADPPSTA